MEKKVRWEFKHLTASYAKQFFERKLTPGMDSGDWSMRDAETGYIYVCPRPNAKFDIRPNWSVIKAEHICVCDPDGNLVDDNGFLPTVELPMHLAIYKARPEIHAIVHSHPLYSSAFAATGEDIPVLLAEQALFLGGDVKCAEYGLVGSQTLADNIVAALGKDHRAALLRNHGAVILGKDLEEAFVLADFLEHGAYVAILSKIVGKPIEISMDNILDPSLVL
ncbi:class II aldolase/adducin family protein [Flexilinea flocculi]|jgi:L-fuculose-phosphate aldolase|uniref:Ribulose-5-phosphate 4-epimerase n=1 Tax=Flexilinea flocculi TaxID=1678840 RepID=A0A0K8PCS5_9CHLR|nr:class II aldolase/adducin family protein [Flexilinea flocculi]GAP39945.1 ribulose-5-phosphate 4-epimerase [Flexilinea flocculi]